MPQVLHFSSKQSKIDRNKKEKDIANIVEHVRQFIVLKCSCGKRESIEGDDKISIAEELYSLGWRKNKCASCNDLININKLLNTNPTSKYYLHTETDYDRILNSLYFIPISRIIDNIYPKLLLSFIHYRKPYYFKSYTRDKDYLGTMYKFVKDDVNYCHVYHHAQD
jgi:hypothetical protein